MWNVKISSDPGLWPRKVSDNIRQQIIEAEPHSLENLSKIMKTVRKYLSCKKMQSFCYIRKHKIREKI
jgi:hypothetical protein